MDVNISFFLFLLKSGFINKNISHICIKLEFQHDSPPQPPIHFRKWQVNIGESSHRKQLNQAAYKNCETWHEMSGSFKNVKHQDMRNRKSFWGRTSTNQLNIVQLTNKTKRSTESSDQTNQNFHIQSLYSTSNWLIWYLLCFSHSTWTKSNFINLNNSQLSLQMDYLAFYTNLVFYFRSKPTSPCYISFLNLYKLFFL